MQHSVPVTPGLIDAQRTNLASLLEALDEGDPGRETLDGALEQARRPTLA